MVDIKKEFDYLIEKGTLADVDELEFLYNDLVDYLTATKNYSGWIKGVYPVRETAQSAINENTLYVLKIDGKIAGSIVLNHNQEDAYEEATWGIEAKREEVIVVRTFVVHPDFLQCGIGQKLLSFAKSFALDKKMKTIRLDTSTGNLPARSLYEKCGYKHVGTVDLRLGIPHLVWFRLYEIIL